ncbi:MAG: hypothetical protein JW931_09660 [Methanomicrobiaceae archaeon]|nr:hypothetical protein [Methanomicrobiaceae archaeon]
MKLNRFNLGIFVFVILISAYIFPVSAVIQETTVSGEVTKITEAENEITIYANEIWNGESWVMYSVTSLTNQKLKGGVPGGNIFKYINVGDTVQATFTGDERDVVTWVTVARVELPDSSSRFLSDSWGDPSNLVSPFFNNFKLSYETIADCSDCSGSLCLAKTAEVTVSQGWEEKNYLQTKTINAGETLIFSSPEGCHSELVVSFVEGQADSVACSGYGVTGPQPFSNFGVHLVQKGSATEVTATPSSSVTEDVTQAATEPEPTQSPGFAMFGAVIGIMVALYARKFI